MIIQTHNKGNNSTKYNELLFFNDSNFHIPYFYSLWTTPVSTFQPYNIFTTKICIRCTFQWHTSVKVCFSLEPKSLIPLSALNFFYFIGENLLEHFPPLHLLGLKGHAFNISPNSIQFPVFSVFDISTKNEFPLIYIFKLKRYLFALRIIFTIIYYYNFPFSQSYANTRHTVQIFLHEKVTLGHVGI